ncbi:Hypothetical protein R9X50_00578300 [Acrodontium crateriforme]|uniref:Uncharacterized protein n=1 Tax=Acrodontium crateriforme TaxID=150365 RepID=A0AAQ3M8M7_9PEZI|nr:Hypothetical protein R9X50_00578300 [Acrodontium crateriforme]
MPSGYPVNPTRDVESSEKTLGPAQDFREFTKDYFQDGELSKYRHILTEMGMTSNGVDYWISMLEKGDDEPLKALLVTQLPRLETLSVFAHNNDSFRPREASFRFIAQMIFAIIRTTNPPQVFSWPPGFLSLRTISLSMPINSKLQPQQQYARSGCEVTTVAALLLLPNIRRLKIPELHQGNPLLHKCMVLLRYSSLEEFEVCGCLRETWPWLLTLLAGVRQLKKLKIGQKLPSGYRDWIKHVHPGCVVLEPWNQVCK